MNIGLLLLLGAVPAGVLIVYLLVRPGAAAVGALHLTRCPRCEQKIRYAANRAGRSGICPQCKYPLTLPSAPPPLEPRTGRKSIGLRRK